MTSATTTTSSTAITKVEKTFKERYPDKEEEADDNDFDGSKCQRWTLVVFLSWMSFLFTGALFGWGPMQLLLESNGSFSSLCDGHNDATSADADGDVCPEQSATLVSVQFYGLCTMMASPFLGEIMDRFGKIAMTCTMTLMIWTGLILFIMGVQYEDYLLFPAYICIALSTWMGSMLFIPSAFLFQDPKTQSRIIILLNALFDAGSVTYLGLWGIGQLNLSLTTIGIMYFAISVFVFGGVCYFIRVAKTAADGAGSQHQSVHSLLSKSFGSATSASMVFATGMETSIHKYEKSLLALDATQGEGILQSCHPGNNNNNKEQGGDNANSDENKKEDEEQGSTRSGDRSDQKKVEMSPDTTTTMMGATESYESSFEVNNPDDDNASYVLIADRTPREQLSSTFFILLAIYWTLIVSFQHFVLTTQREFLAFLGDDDQNNKYLNIFTILQPVSFFFAPFTDGLIQFLGFPGTFQVINILSVVFWLIRLLSSSLDVQIFAFLVFSFLRCLFFGTFFSFLPTVMSLNVMGKAVGIIYVISGIASLVNVQLSQWAIEGNHGDFFYPDLIYTLGIGPAALVSYTFCYLAIKESRLR